MKIVLEKINQNITQGLTLLGIFTFFYLFSKSISGYVLDQQKLSLFADMIMSSGIFIVGFPLLARILSCKNQMKKNQLQALKLLLGLLQVVVGFLTLIFIFGFHNYGSVGFIQLPKLGGGLFLVIMILSVLAAVLALLQAVHSTQQKDSMRNKWDLIQV